MRDRVETPSHGREDTEASLLRGLRAVRLAAEATTALRISQAEAGDTSARRTSRVAEAVTSAAAVVVDTSAAVEVVDTSVAVEDTAVAAVTTGNRWQ